jgi:hypothetical protein|tara:strand:- start:203 stop:370 length:168 start_codon:yes stop_codon:yes gene_type:complete
LKIILTSLSELLNGDLGAWYYKKDNVFKVILFTVGGNKMPKPEKMTKLFEILKSN